MSRFKRATKEQTKARVALVGPSGSGKTYTALAVATGLGQRIALIDTERGSARKYADIFKFDVLELEHFHPKEYIEAIADAAKERYDVLVIDSLSHAWMGRGGALELVDKAAKRAQGNSYVAWRDVTPLQRRLVDSMLQAPMHLLATMRAKTDYVLEAGRGGKMRPRKVGMAPIQRDGVEYEFDIVGELDLDHNLIVSKTRCAALDNAVIELPGQGLGEQIAAWLTDGAEAPKPEQPKTKAGIDVAGICAAKEDVLLCADWTPKDLEAFISEWKVQIQAWKPLVETLLEAGASRLYGEQGKRRDFMKALLEHGKWERFDMSEADLAAAWCALVCPPEVVGETTFEIDERLEQLVHTPGALKLRRMGIATREQLEERIRYEPDEIAAALGDDVYKHLLRVFGLGEGVDYVARVNEFAARCLEMEPRDAARQRALLIEQVATLAGQELAVPWQEARGYMQAVAGNVRLEDLETTSDLARVWRKTIETRRAAA